MNYILLTIDVEDWFQVENFKQCIPFSSWPDRELRVEANTHRLLDLLDSQGSVIRGQRSVSTNSTSPSNVSDSFRRRRIFTPCNATPISQGEVSQFHQETEKKEKSRKSRKSSLTPASPKATFFVLAWIAERLPHLVREIRARGHEIASHGYYHNLCNQQSPNALKKDLTDSKKLLEDIIGSPVVGYRAPSFSISNEILKLIEECGYLYDSSYNSFALHGRYGHINLSQNGSKGIAIQISNSFYELAISNMKLGIHTLPWGGGTYFRLIPSPLFEMGVRSILKKHGAYLFYLHPWEIDPEQPKVNEAPSFYRFRHYVNLDKTESKLSSFIESFKECHFVTCHQYLEENL